MEVSHNLFDFTVEDDVGHVICNFGKAKVPGPIWFHNNLVKNPGRGIMWTHGPHDNIEIYNNHIISDTTTRKDGFFGIEKSTNFKTVVIKNNIIENTEKKPRPLLRNDQSYGAKIENNLLKNVSDTDKYKNPETGEKQGLVEPLKFKCGVNGEYTVDGWKISKTGVSSK